ncbi:hypothetical protein IG631_11956 [Alternaria alternata]|nr:hypothetical protein IG631_11956 [Alternaria alternata]
MEDRLQGDIWWRTRYGKRKKVFVGFETQDRWNERSLIAAQPKHKRCGPSATVLELGLSISSHQPSCRWHVVSWFASHVRIPLIRFSTAGSVFLSPSRIGTTRWYRRSRFSEFAVTAATKNGQTG